jgi:hypothetical protein
MINNTCFMQGNMVVKMYVLSACLCPYGLSRSTEYSAKIIRNMVMKFYIVTDLRISRMSSAHV